MEELTGMMKKSRLFSGIPEEKISQLIMSLDGHIKKMSKGEFWINEGMKVEELGIVLKGELAVLRVFTNGRENLMQKLKAVSVTGLDIVCTAGQRSPYDIRTDEDTVLFQFTWKSLSVPGKVDEEIRQVVMHNILRMISHENIRKTYKIEILMQKRLRDKIMTYLLIQREKRKKDTFTIPYSREEMASFLCVNRSALSHELSLMENDGLIRFNQNEFEILWTKEKK